jgi:formate hydrogenlyase transcriptional activator
MTFMPEKTKKVKTKTSLQVEGGFAKYQNFEQLLSRLSTEFISFPCDQIEDRILFWLEKVVVYFQTDRGTISKFVDQKRKLVAVHSWAKEGLEPVPKNTELHTLWPWTVQKLIDGKAFFFSKTSEYPTKAALDRKNMEKYQVISLLTVPMMVGGQPMGMFSCSTTTRQRAWSKETIINIQLIADIFGNALARLKSEQELRAAFSKIKVLKSQLEAENEILREEVRLTHNFREIVGESEAIGRTLAQVEQVADTDATTLIQGETGTGKELIANAIHNTSLRKDRLMIKVNCAAIPNALLESELFGREKGAYTGSLSRQIGRFELAHKSTILLDEVGEMPLELQAKLLRVLQDGIFERLGSSTPMKADVRIIASTNRNIDAAVEKGEFRKDLFFRLNVFRITVPPLRKRLEDIPALTWHFIRRYEKKLNRKIGSISRTTMEQFQAYSWPGNIRELMNVIEHGMIVSPGKVLRVEIPSAEANLPGKHATLEQNEKRHILAVLKTTGWRIRGKEGAAEILGVKPTTLEYRIKRLGLSRPKNKSK